MKIISLIILFIISFSLSATQQQNDLIEYNGQLGEISIDWSYLSPLEVYYSQNSDVDNPFKSSHTANYRGHIATWEVKNKRFYLTKIATEKSTFDKVTNKVTSVKTNIPLIELFPTESVNNNKVFANWFSGYMLIKTEPFKQWQDSPYDDEKYYIMEYREYQIVKVEEGTITENHTYDAEQFWRIQGRLHGYKSIESKDKDVFNSFNEYIASFRGFENDGTVEPKQKKIMHTEDDFEMFIQRSLVRNINVPLSDYCILKDVTVNTKGSGWTSEREFRIKKGSYLLYLEMGSTNVPNGPWDDFTGGSVQVLIPFDDLNEGSSLTNESVNNNISFINNFAKFGSPQSITVDLTLNKIDSNNVSLSGDIGLFSEEPSTSQKISLNNKVPLRSLREHLELNKSDSGYIKYDVDDLYEKIVEKSN
jgi:hypothetical protein